MLPFTGKYYVTCKRFYSIIMCIDVHIGDKGGLHMNLDNYILKLESIYNFTSNIVFENIRDIEEYEQFYQVWKDDKEKLDLPAPIILPRFDDKDNVFNIAYYLDEDRTLILNLENTVKYSDILEIIDIVELIYLFLNEGQFLPVLARKALQDVVQSLFLKSLSPMLSDKALSSDSDHYKAEVDLFSQIQYGNRLKLIQKHRNFMIMHKVGKLSKNNEDKSKKHLIISTITLATRYAIEGGVPQRVSYSISDLLIQEYDSTKEKINITEDTLSIMLTYCDQVIKYKSNEYSPLIKDIITFITTNIYQKITLNDIAHQFNYTTSHLSKKFKQETKLSITQFINKEKINEAKQLLIFSNISINEISFTLNFVDYSHFSKVFKQFEDMTPYEYLKKNKHLGFNNQK